MTTYATPGGCTFKDAVASAPCIPLIFTKHAEERMRERGIAHGDVQAALLAPERTSNDPSHEGALIASCRLAGPNYAELAVVYRDSSKWVGQKVVITVYIRRTSGGKWN